MADILGIDLGTTKSVMAVWRDGAPQVIPNAEGERITPSVVAWEVGSERWVVGQRALEMASHAPDAAVYSIKRLMGRHFHEAAVQKHLAKHVLYEVAEPPERPDGIEVVVGGQHLTPQEVSAKILQKLRVDAETHLGRPITQAVITVPAYFNDSQRQATRDAGRIAGLDVKMVLNEPTAACLAYGYKSEVMRKERRVVAVYDLGGGTFDISIMQVGRGPFSVLAISGNTFLGGTDVDWDIVDWILALIGGEDQQRLQADEGAKALLRAMAEHAKRKLSEVEQATIEVPAECVPGGRRLTLTRAQLEVLARRLVEDTLIPCGQAQRDARLPRGQAIQEVLLVGGQTRMPAVRKAVKRHFGVEPDTSLPPEEVVALGAAVQAAVFAKEVSGLKLYDAVPLSLGVKTLGGVMDVLIHRNTNLPFSASANYSTPHEGQDAVEIEIYQGEHPLVAQNVRLGSFMLDGLGLAGAGDPEIEVVFRVDDYGILQVTARETQSGKEKSLTITDSVRLSDDQITAMVKEAQAHLPEYEAQRRQAELRAQVDSLRARLAALIAPTSPPLPAELAATITSTLAGFPPKDWAAYWHELGDLLRRAKDLQSDQAGH